MKLISLLTSDSAADLDCDYTLIELTPELARIALRRIDAFKAQKAADRDLDEMYFWDFRTPYFSPWIAEKAGEAEALDEMLSRFPAVASGSDWMTAPDSFSVPESMAARVDCCQMIVREDAIAFVAIPKHTDCYVRTGQIPLHLIDSVACA